MNIAKIMAGLESAEETIKQAHAESLRQEISEARWVLRLQRARLAKRASDNGDCFQILTTEYRAQVEETKRRLANLNARLRGRK